MDSTLVLYTLCIVIQLCLLWGFYTTLFILGIFCHYFWILEWLFYVVDFDTAFHFEILTQFLNFVDFDTGFILFLVDFDMVVLRLSGKRSNYNILPLKPPDWWPTHFIIGAQKQKIKNCKCCSS